MSKQILVLGRPSMVNERNYDCLFNNDCVVDFVKNLSVMKKHLSKSHCDLIIVDSDLQDVNYDQFLPKFKNFAGDTPVVVVSDNSEEQIIVDSLNFGADLFLHRSMNSSVFSASIAAFLRSQEPAQKSDIVKAGPFSFEIGTLSFYKKGKKIGLTKKESILMKLMMDHPGQVFSVEELYRAAWESGYPDKNTIMVYINRLREKIEENKKHPQYIKNVRGKGYTLIV